MEEEAGQRPAMVRAEKCLDFLTLQEKFSDHFGGKKFSEAEREAENHILSGDGSLRPYPQVTSKSLGLSGPLIGKRRGPRKKKVDSLAYAKWAPVVDGELGKAMELTIPEQPSVAAWFCWGLELGLAAPEGREADIVRACVVKKESGGQQELKGLARLQAFWGKN